MLKVKEAIHNPSDKTKDQVSQLQNDIKNSIKKYIQTIKKKDKTIKEYASLISEIRKEYNMFLKKSRFKSRNGKFEKLL